jgi:hypothetical protein
MRNAYLRFAIAIVSLTACGGSSSGDDDDDNGVDAATAVCGNGACEAGETPASCAADCDTSTCGDGTCDPDENTSTCPADCPAPACSPTDPTSCSGETVCIAGSCENAFGRNYHIRVIGAVFTEKKANGDSWDLAGGLPDGKTTVKIDSVAATTPVINDTLTPDWNFLSSPTLIPGGAVLQIDVVDSDVLGDDPAWSCTNNPLSADLIRGGARCSGVGALADAHVDIAFEPI